METQGQSGKGRTAAALAVLAIVCFAMGATLVYYNSVLNHRDADSNSATTTTTSTAVTTSTETTTATTTVAKTATTTATTMTPIGGTALAIYGNTSKSVVTIVGINETTANYGPFGTYVSYSVIEGSG
jgi:hypothetical protein